MTTTLGIGAYSKSSRDRYPGPLAPTRPGLSIAEAARRTGISAHALCYSERAGRIAQPQPLPALTSSARMKTAHGLKHYGTQPAVTALMVEIRRDMYMIEPGDPLTTDIDRITEALTNLVNSLSARSSGSGCAESPRQ